MPIFGQAQGAAGIDDALGVLDPHTAARPGDTDFEGRLSLPLDVTVPKT